MKHTIRKALLFAGLCYGVIAPAAAQILSLDSVLATIDRQNPMLGEFDNRAKAFDEYA